MKSSDSFVIKNQTDLLIPVLSIILRFIMMDWSFEQKVIVFIFDSLLCFREICGGCGASRSYQPQLDQSTKLYECGTWLDESLFPWTQVTSQSVFIFFFFFSETQKQALNLWAGGFPFLSCQLKIFFANLSSDLNNRVFYLFWQDSEVTLCEPRGRTEVGKYL